MAILKIQGQKLIPIKEKEWPSERHVQKLTEKNLEAVFPDLQLVATEFPVENFRIDTLAFNTETKAFVIIEYKRGRSFSVIDQGYSYLSLMLRHKAEFILEYNEKIKKGGLKRRNVDWSQSRILFLARSFTTHQKNAINFRDLPIELWEVELYDNSTILYKQIPSSEASESVKKITGDKTVETVNKEVKIHTVEYHMNKTTEEIRNLFQKFRERILDLNGTREEAKKIYISYRAEGSIIFAYLYLQKTSIKIHTSVPRSELNDPRGISRDLSPTHNPCRTEIPLDRPADLLYVLELADQCYRYTNQ